MEELSPGTTSLQLEYQFFRIFLAKIMHLNKGLLALEFKISNIHAGGLVSLQACVEPKIVVVATEDKK